MSSIRVIVTGAGSIVGQGIVKALRHSPLPIRVICTDIEALNPGLYRADEAAVLPPVEKPGSVEVWIDAIRRLRADVLMIGSEFDLRFFSEHRATLQAETSCTVIASPPAVVEVADDKLATARFLSVKGLPFAKAIALESTEDPDRCLGELGGYPLVLKPRRGTSARHVQVIRDSESLRYWFPRTPKPMLQEYLQEIPGAIGGEFTCSTFRCADGTLLGPFVSRRTLRGGSSWIVEIAHDLQIRDLMLSIGRLLPSVGSHNVQLILTERGPIPFEFNARFSGTTPIRAYFGFNEPEMAIRSYFLGEAIQPPEIRRGFCMRYVEEIMFTDVPLGTVPAKLPVGVINHWF